MCKDHMFAILDLEMPEDKRREINIRNTNITDILDSLTGSRVLKLVLPYSLKFI